MSAHPYPVCIRLSIMQVNAGQLYHEVQILFFFSQQDPLLQKMKKTVILYINMHRSTNLLISLWSQTFCKHKSDIHILLFSPSR